MRRACASWFWSGRRGNRVDGAFVKSQLEAALDRTIRLDSVLISRGVGERAISHRVATYLEASFPDLSVDCEYNRRGDDPKSVVSAVLRELSNQARNLTSTREEVRTTPDIIVHRRGVDSDNILAVEVKVRASGGDQRSSALLDFDRAKLRYYMALDGLQYQMTAQVVFWRDDSGDAGYDLTFVVNPMNIWLRASTSRS